MVPKPVVLAAAALLGCADLVGIDDWDPTSGAASTAAGQGGTGGGAGGIGNGAATSVSSASSGAGGAAGGGLSPYAAAVLADGPAEYWPLDETGGTIATSLAPDDAHDGTFTATVTLGRPPLVSGTEHSARFASGADFVYVGDVHDYAGKSPFSLEAWVSVAGGGPYESPINKLDGAANGYILWINETSLVYLRRSVDGNGAGPDGVGPMLQPGLVYHLVATYDGYQSCVYVNGVLQECVTDDYSIADTGAPLVLGGSLNGDLDEVAIYAKPLDPMRIAAHYAAGTAR